MQIILIFGELAKDKWKMSKSKLTYLVTGAAGFIGSALIIKLLKKGETVIGIDNLNTYYDQSLKNSRLENINKISESINSDWKFYKCDLEDLGELIKIGRKHKIKIVINLAAQAGVRYSLENPNAYVRSNLVGFANILEFCKLFDVENFIYASSSSVYGGNKDLPFKEENNVDKPISFYAATKKSNELMAYAYSHLFKIPSIGLRFFTVYGPWGRPDMAAMIFTKAILNKEKINVFNQGKMQRDFTYIDDIVEGIIGCCLKPIKISKNEGALSAPHEIFNIGNNQPINLISFIEMLEEELGKKAIKKFLPLQPGDVISTHADQSKLKNWIDFTPKTSLKIGIKKFVQWYKEYYSI